MIVAFYGLCLRLPFSFSSQTMEHPPQNQPAPVSLAGRHIVVQCLFICNGCPLFGGAPVGGLSDSWGGFLGSLFACVQAVPTVLVGGVFCLFWHPLLIAPVSFFYVFYVTI